ncbi:MAG: hypothetical protein ABSD81_05265 [Methanomicrobiales archaeon]|jgi:hypothetical protein
MILRVGLLGGYRPPAAGIPLQVRELVNEVPENLRTYSYLTGPILTRGTPKRRG